VDDTHLGYMALAELRALLGEFRAEAERSSGGCAAAAFPALVAECFACRVPVIVDVGVEALASEAAWACACVLREALSAGQDPDCRGQVPCFLRSSSFSPQSSGRALQEALDSQQNTTPFSNGVRAIRGHRQAGCEGEVLWVRRCCW